MRIWFLKYKKYGYFLSLAFLSLTLSALACFVSPALANIAPLETTAREAILIDAATGTVLFDKNADARMPTSSMSKVLTTYLTFEAIRAGKLHLNDTLTVSEQAWKQEGSRTFLNIGQNVKVEDLVRGVIIQSGNDAAVVLAEALGGSEGNFAAMLNAKAHELGMNNSHFMNATGLPDPQHYSTAHDLAKMAIATIRDFPEDFHYYSEKEFTFNNIKQGNRNPLLYRNIGVDGLKTGHAEEAGYGLIASALRNGRRMILVVNGLSNMQERADEPTKILDWGYREWGLYPVLSKGKKLAEAPVWLGTEKTVPLIAGGDLSVSLPRSDRNNLKVTVEFNQPLTAPVLEGTTVGKIIITGTPEPIEVPLLTGKFVGEVGFFERFGAKLHLLLGKE